MKNVQVREIISDETTENLSPLDPEIERTLKRILRDKRAAVRIE